MTLSVPTLLSYAPTTTLFDFEFDFVTGLGGSGVSAFVTTFLVGAVLIALAPEYAARMIDDLQADPADSFVYGLLVLVGFIILIVALAITIIGILVVIPLVLVAVLVWAAGSAVAFLTVGERLLDVDGAEDGWMKPLLVGAAVNGGLALTGIGGLVSFCLGAAGFGAIIRDWRDK